MNRIWKLLKYELQSYHRSYHIIKHCAYVMLLSNIIFSIMISSSEHNIQLKMLLIIFGSIISTITIPSYLIKSEIQDGSLENLLAIVSPITILLAKYGALVISSIIGIFSTLPIIGVFYSLPLYNITYVTTMILLLMFQIIAIVLLGNIIHAYFRHNTNVILTIITPLIIPSLILASIGLNSFSIDFILILLGLGMILVPIILVLSNYLLSNLYEF